MMLGDLLALTVVACPNCISSVGGSGESYMWGTVAMIAAPVTMAGVMFYMFRKAALGAR